MFAAQAFETALVPIFEFFKMQTEPGYVEKTGGYVGIGMFKVPVTNIVKTLSERGSIAPDLKVRMLKYCEDRHLLIHRWMMNHGWPDETDFAGFVPIIELANRVESEARALTKLLVWYLLKYARPESPQEHAEYTERMATLFKQAHLDV